MPFAAFLLLFFCFLLTLACGFIALTRTGTVRKTYKASPASVPEKGSLVFFALLNVASFLLFGALASGNFSFLYVYEHTDRVLPLFYRLAAFWAGQEGALLFWAWCTALCCVLFQNSRGYRSLHEDTKLWYWGMYFTIMGFFCLLLTAWNNPFFTAEPVPANGSGLNPLLQNPGMVFHPPLLFMGYGAFTVPCCLALAAVLPARPVTAKANRGRAAHPVEATPWAAVTRPFILAAWLLLGAGILLGAWWSYMELGWGGYWAWDPVENASLIPWLVATAYLHTALVEEHNGKLGRTNVFLMALVTVSAFFATYLVRGGVVRSVHAFGESAVGVPLLAFVLLFLAFVVYAAWSAPKTGAPLGFPFTREGMLVGTAWVFMALAVIIVLGTLWPVISTLWSEKSVGLSPAFYNTVCLPLFALLASLLAMCPWVGWKGRVASKMHTVFVLLVAHGFGAMLAFMGLRKLLPLVSASAAVAIIASVCILVFAGTGMLRRRASLAAHGVHLGFALIVIGVAFSGPYKTQENVVLRQGQTVIIGEYAITLSSVRGGDSHDHMAGPHPDHATSPPAYMYSEAVLDVTRNGARLGQLRPQLRRYATYPDSVFSEVDTVFSWGNELYCSMLGIESDGATTVQISINPLVNWIWAGSVALCLFPLVGLFSRRREMEKGSGAASGGGA